MDDTVSHYSTSTSQALKHLKHSSLEFKHNLFTRVNGKIQMYIFFSYGHKFFWRLTKAIIQQVELKDIDMEMPRELYLGSKTFKNVNANT